MSEFVDVQNEILPNVSVRNIHHHPVGVFSEEVPLPFGGDESLIDPGGSFSGVGYNVDLKLLIKEDLTSTDDMPRWFNIPFFTEYVKIYTIQVVSSQPGSVRPLEDTYTHAADEEIKSLLGDPKTRKTNLKSFIRGATEDIIGPDWTARLREQGSMLNMIKAHAYKIMEESNYQHVIRVKETNIREIKSGFEIGNKVVGAEDFVKDRAAVDLFHSVNSLSGKKIYDIPYVVKFEEDDKLSFINDGYYSTKHVSYFNFVDLDVFGLAQEINLNIVEDWYGGNNSDSIINQFSGRMLHNVAWQSYTERNVAQDESTAETGFRRSYSGPPLYTNAFFTLDGEQYFGSVTKAPMGTLSAGTEWYTGHVYREETSKPLSIRRIRNQTITWDTMDSHDWVSRSVGDVFYDLENPFNMGYGRISSFPEEISALSLAKPVSSYSVVLDKEIRSRVIQRERENANSDGISENLIHNISPSGQHSFGFFLETDRIISSQSRFRGLLYSAFPDFKSRVRDMFRIDSIRVFRKRADIEPTMDCDLEEELVVSGKEIQSPGQNAGYGRIEGYKFHPTFRDAAGNLIKINSINEVDNFTRSIFTEARGTGGATGQDVRFVTFADGELHQKTDGKYTYRYELSFQDPVYLVLAQHLDFIEQSIKKMSVFYDYASIPSSTGFFDQTDFSVQMTPAEFGAWRAGVSASGRSFLGKVRDFSRESVYGSTGENGIFDGSYGSPSPTALMISEKGAFNYKTGVYSEEFKTAFAEAVSEEKFGITDLSLRAMVTKWSWILVDLYPETEIVHAGVVGDFALQTAVDPETGERYGRINQASIWDHIDHRTMATSAMLSPLSPGARPEYILKFKNSMINLAMALRKLLGDYSSPEAKISLDLDEAIKTKSSSIREHKKSFKNVIDINHNHNFSVYFLPLAADGTNLARRGAPADALSGQHFPVVSRTVLLENFRREYSLNSEDEVSTSTGIQLVTSEDQYVGYLLPSKYYYTDSSLAYGRNRDNTPSPELLSCQFNNHDARFFTTFNFTNEHNKVKELYKIFRPSYGFVGTSKKDVRHSYVPHEHVLKPADARQMRMFSRAQFNLSDFGVSFRWDRSPQVLDEAAEDLNIQELQRIMPDEIYEDLTRQLEQSDQEDLGLASRSALREIKEYVLMSRAYGNTVNFYDESSINQLTQINMNDPYYASMHTGFSGLKYRPFRMHSRDEWNWNNIIIGPALQMQEGSILGENVVPPHLLAAAHDWPRPPRDQGRGWGPAGRLMNRSPLGETENLSYFYHGMLAKIMVYVGHSDIHHSPRDISIQGAAAWRQLDRVFLTPVGGVATGRYLLCKISYYENNYFGIGQNILQKHIPVSDEYFLLDRFS